MAALDAGYQDLARATLEQAFRDYPGTDGATATAFATAFYHALGYGKDVQTAFDLGCGEIDLSQLEEQDVPKLIARRTTPAAAVHLN